MDRYTALRIAVEQDLEGIPSGPITSDLEPRTVACMSLRASLLKKREVWSPELLQGQKDRALKTFLESNDACKSWAWQPMSTIDDMFEGELKSFLSNLLDPLDPTEAFTFSTLSENMGPGPGASVGANADNFFTKLFASPISHTSEYLVALYRAATCERPGWAEAENIRFQSMDAKEERAFKLVDGNTWFSVPKNEETERSCATEPSINMLFQKALGDWIESRLNKVLNLDLADQQQLNSRLALMGSQMGLFGTIDLSSASDRNALSMIEHFCPPSFNKWIRLFRSPLCRLPDGTSVAMHMCSSMGNGFTFPLQTALFAGVVFCCYKLCGIPFIRNRRVSPYGFDQRRKPGNWGTFGDDIIVDTRVYHTVIRYLNMLGHKVNDSKSFNSGGFRESCGSDYFYGYNVRGVYIRSLETPLDVYSAINRLTRWSASHGVNLSLSIRLLLGWVKFLPVPFAAADYEGVKVPYDKSHEPQNRGRSDAERDAADWQCPLYRGLTVSSSQHLVTPLSKGEGLAITRESDGVDSMYARNIYGLYVAALGGFVRTPPYRVGLEVAPIHVIGVRRMANAPKRWKVKLRPAPVWVRTPVLPGPVFGTDRGDAWESVAGRHIYLSLLPRV